MSSIEDFVGQKFVHKEWWNRSWEIKNLNLHMLSAVSKYVGEMDTNSQFHQHFMSSFCANILLKKIYKSKLYIEKSFAKHFCTKKAHVKCWWNWHQVSCVGKIKLKKDQIIESPKGNPIKETFFMKNKLVQNLLGCFNFYWTTDCYDWNRSKIIF